jgi:hypothetical protein
MESGGAWSHKIERRHPVTTWRVQVGRVREPGDDNTPLAWERHRARAEVVRAAFREAPDWSVQDWGDLDDQERTHETIEMIVDWIGQIAQDPLVQSSIERGIELAGEAMEDLVKDGIKEMVKGIGSGIITLLIARCWPMIKSGKVANVGARTEPSAEGSIVSVEIDRPGLRIRPDRIDPTEPVWISISSDIKLGPVKPAAADRSAPTSRL